MFLTLEDPRAQVTGSRDPIGAQVLWTAFGRHLVGNLTTVTTSVPGFTVLLLGRLLAQVLVEDERLADEDAVGAFLRFEQVAGYVRHVVHGVDEDIRGIRRIRRRLATGESSVSIGLAEEDQILADQRTYGLWGLYTVASRVSGLLPDGPIGGSPAVRHVLETGRLPRLGRSRERLLRLVADGGPLSVARGDVLLEALGALLDPTMPPAEEALYARCLRDGEQHATESVPVGGPGGGRQHLLAGLMEKHLDLGKRIGRAEVEALREAARPLDPGLWHRLDRVLHLEAFLAPAEALFEHVVVRNGQPLDSVAREVERRWGAGLPHLRADGWAELWDEVRTLVGGEHAGLLAQLYGHLTDGAYGAAIEDLVRWNGLVMEGRGGAPWVRIERGRLDVHQTVVEGLLPERDDLPTLWRNTYFLDALRLITRQLPVGAK